MNVGSGPVPYVGSIPGPPSQIIMSDLKNEHKNGNSQIILQKRVVIIKIKMKNTKVSLTHYFSFILNHNVVQILVSRMINLQLT